MGDKGKELYMYILGALVVIAAFAVVVIMLFVPVPSTSNNAVMLGLGTLLSLAVSVVGYFFGSSKSSADKNEMLGTAVSNGIKEVKKEVS